MGVCALTAAADDAVALEDHRSINQAIRTEPSPAVLDVDKATQILDEYITELTRALTLRAAWRAPGRRYSTPAKDDQGRFATTK